MEECSVLIETTKSAENKTSRWFDLPIDYELFRDLLGVEADSNDYQITDMKLPFCWLHCKVELLSRLPIPRPERYADIMGNLPWLPEPCENFLPAGIR